VDDLATDDGLRPGARGDDQQHHNDESPNARRPDHHLHNASGERSVVAGSEQRRRGRVRLSYLRLT
jgi:hypothetical protein